MTTFRFRCASITEELSDDETIWRVTLRPSPFPEDTTNGSVKYGGRDGGEIKMTIFDQALARTFQVGQYYSADFERVDPPGRQ